MQRYVAKLLSVVALSLGSVDKGLAGEDDRVRVLAKHVERICGGKIRELPTVLVVDEPTFWKALKAEVWGSTSNQELDPRKTLPLGVFYQPKTNTILFRRGYDAVGEQSMTIAEVEQFRRMELFHELVHVWQYQNIPPELMTASGSELVKQALREGHAEYATYKFCQAEKIERLYERILQQREGAREAIVPQEMMDVYFLYVEGFRFFQFLAAQDPPLGIVDVFKRGLPTERQIVYPQEYLAGRGSARVSFAWLTDFFVEADHQAPSRYENNEVGFTALRMYLRRIGVRGEMGKRQLDSFLNGFRLSNGSCQLTALAFESADLADQCFEAVRKNHSTRTPRDIAVQKAADGSGVRFASHRLSDRNRNRRVSTLLIVDGSVVIEVNDFTEQAFQTAEDQWVEGMLKRYLGLRKDR